MTPVTGAELADQVRALAGGHVDPDWRASGNWGPVADRLNAGKSCSVIVEQPGGWARTRQLGRCSECGTLMLTVNPARTCSVRCRVRRHRRL